jgi:hypothetical protein
MPFPSKILFYSFILLVNALLYSCSNETSGGPAISDIPQYPNSEQGETMQQSMLGMSGSIQQYSTEDGFQQVLSFYEKELAQYAPDVMTHNLADGRQSAISIKNDNGALTIAIQEFKDEAKVIITFMEVSK